MNLESLKIETKKIIHTSMKMGGDIKRAELLYSNHHWIQDQIRDITLRHPMDPLLFPLEMFSLKKNVMHQK